MPGVAEVLARESRAQPIHPPDRGPIDGRDIAKVRDRTEPLSQHVGGERVGLGVPGHRTTDDGLQAHLKAAIAAAQRTDQHGRALRYTPIRFAWVEGSVEGSSRTHTMTFRNAKERIR